MTYGASACVSVRSVGLWVSVLSVAGGGSGEWIWFVDKIPKINVTTINGSEASRLRCDSDWENGGRRRRRNWLNDKSRMNVIYTCVFTTTWSRAFSENRATKKSSLWAFRLHKSFAAVSHCVAQNTHTQHTPQNSVSAKPKTSWSIYATSKENACENPLLCVSPSIAIGRCEHKKQNENERR